MQINLVDNWKEGYKWFSNWSLGLITFIAVTPIPEPIAAVLPENAKAALIAASAISGIILRFVNQTK